MTDAAARSEESSKPFCVHCVTGYRLPGEPRGRIEKIGTFDTYLAEPSTGVQDTTKAIIFFTDAFGLGLDNNKILADRLAQATGLSVYAPDLFGANPVPEASLANQPDTAEQLKNASILTKLTSVAKFAVLAPWFFKYRPSTVLPRLEEYLGHIKSQYNYHKLGGIGYCYGGKPVLVLNGKGLIDVSVANHPSFISAGDITALRNPTLFNCAQEDPIFPISFAQKQEKELKARTGAPTTEFKYYKNTVHGFGARPNLALPDVKLAFEDAFAAAVGFYKAHL